MSRLDDYLEEMNDVGEEGESDSNRTSTCDDHDIDGLDDLRAKKENMREVIERRREESASPKPDLIEMVAKLQLQVHDLREEVAFLKADRNHIYEQLSRFQDWADDIVDLVRKAFTDNE